MKFKRNPQYFYWGVTILAVVMVSIILWVIFSNLSGFFSLCDTVLQIFSPVIYGIIFAYIMNPIMVFAERHLLPLLRRAKLSEKRVRSMGRAFSVVIAILVCLAAVYGFFALLLPNLINSISGIAANMAAVLFDGAEMGAFSGGGLSQLFRHHQHGL